MNLNWTLDRVHKEICDIYLWIFQKTYANSPPSYDEYFEVSRPEEDAEDTSDGLPQEHTLRRSQTEKHFVVNINNPFRVKNAERIKEARWRHYNTEEPIPCLLCF